MVKRIALGISRRRLRRTLNKHPLRISREHKGWTDETLNLTQPGQ